MLCRFSIEYCTLKTTDGFIKIKIYIHGYFWSYTMHLFYFMNFAILQLLVIFRSDLIRNKFYTPKQLSLRSSRLKLFTHYTNLQINAAVKFSYPLQTNMQENYSQTALSIQQTPFCAPRQKISCLAAVNMVDVVK